MIDLQKMRENFVGHDNATHYEGCEYAHPLCAIEALCREVERLRERTVLAEHTLNESYDGGSPQAMALAMAILDGDRNAIADAERNMQKRQERAAAYACPSCDIDDGWSGADSERERVYPPKPDRLPAPDTMPSDLAPAQMVEWGDGSVVRADRCDWAWLASERWEYRPLYSDSGLPLCSAEGLEEWARFVVTPESGDPAQCPKKPELGVKFWIAAGWTYAPQTHRKPGNWRESLMEVMQ